MGTGANAVNTSEIYAMNQATAGSTSESILIENNSSGSKTTWKVSTVWAVNTSAAATAFKFGFQKYSNAYGTQDQRYWFAYDTNMQGKETNFLIDKTRPLYLYTGDALVIQCDPVADIKFFVSYEIITST